MTGPEFTWPMNLALVLPLEHLRSKLNTTTDRGLFWDQTPLNVSILHK